MTARDIEALYNHYKNSIYASRSLERQLIKESYTFDKWKDSLRHKSDTIRQMYSENETLISNVINELIANPDELTEELAHMFLAQIDFFLSEGYRDFYITVPVLEILIPFFKEREAKHLLFDCYYFLALAILEQHEYDESLKYYTLALDMYNSIDEIDKDYRMYRFCCGHYYRLLAATHIKSIHADTIYEYATSTIKVWCHSSFTKMLDEKRIQTIHLLVKSLIAIRIDELIESNEVIAQSLICLVQEEYQHQLNLYKDMNLIDTRIFVVYHKHQYFTNCIDLNTYKQLLFEKYDYNSRVINNSYTFGSTNFTMLFDNEFPDEDFSSEKIFYVNPSYTHIYSLIPELFKYTTDSITIAIYIAEIIKYYSDMPIITGECLIDTRINKNLFQILPYMSSINDISHLFSIIFTKRQVMTAIHSNMVYQLAYMLAEHILSINSSMFIGTLDISSDTELLNRTDELLEFIKNAALMHDIGKIYCSDIINLHVRKLTKTEALMLKNHPKYGREIADSIPLLYEYKDIIYLHHKSYDGKNGYPESDDSSTYINNNEIKLVTDIITICDCIDAATDTLGRNYAKPKDFLTVFKELQESAGTQYSKEIVDFIANDNNLIAQFIDLTSNRRERTYFEIYHRYVEDNISFHESDEITYSMMNEGDLYNLSKLSGNDITEIENYFSECTDSSYVFMDGHGKIFGYSFTKAVRNTLVIEDLVVFKEYRHNGYGSRFYSIIENMAKRRYFTKIAMPIRESGHNDKFCYVCGFTNRLGNGYIEKLL